MKKILSLVLCLMLVFAASALAEQTATEVITEAAGKVYDSVRCKMSVDAQADVTVQGGGMSMSIPVKVDGNFEYATKIGHGNVSLNLNFMGQVTDQGYEFYLDASNDDSAVLYMSEDNGATWTCKKGSMEEIGVGTESVEIPEEFAEKVNAAATVETDAGKTTVTIPLSCMIEIAQEQGADKAVSQMAGEYGDLTEQVVDALKDVNLVINTDKDGYFNGLHINDVDASVSTEIEGMPVDANVKLDADIDVLALNADELFVEIPQEVIDNAVEVIDDGLIDADNMMADDSDDADANDAADVETTTASDGELDLGSMPADALGSLNGVNFAKGATGYGVFADDGWVPEYEGEYNFLVLTNEKYDKYFNCSVFSFPFADNVTVEMLMSNGVGGYDMSVNKLENPAPAMTWCGLTWGASSADLKAAYGTPAYEYKSSDGTHSSYTYMIDKANNWDIMFSFDNDQLTGVKMRCDK